MASLGRSTSPLMPLEVPLAESERKLFQASSDTNPLKKFNGKIGNRKLDVQPDIPDLRDRMYEPSLRDLKLKLDPPPGIRVRNQGNLGACTGFGLAAVIDHLNSFPERRGGGKKFPRQVSTRMLYEMAKLHDEWEGTEYEGSSIRGALKGFFHNGVCSEKDARYDEKETGWTLSVEQAKKARWIGLGAYFRLRPNINEYHAALNETQAIYCSAYIHDGWLKPEKGRIVSSMNYCGGHAFAIVGYNREGFLVLNSWGKDWGKFDNRSGVALWDYHDWAVNVMDAWVLRLSVPTPEAFDIASSAGPGFGMAARQEARNPRRSDIIGHFANIDDGKLVETGPFATPLESLEKTAQHLAVAATSGPRKYDHIMFYAHGGLNTLEASARRIHAMKEVFKRNRIYPMHLMWGTGLSEEFFDALTGAFTKSTERVGGFTDILDAALEKIARPIGRAVWQQMKDDAKRSFLTMQGGDQVVKLLMKMNDKLDRPYKIHLVGHSAGSILHGFLLEAIWGMKLKKNGVIGSVSLMAPACSVDFFENYYKPRIGRDRPDGIGKLNLYRLTDKLERDDTVGSIYRKSLLYLVSNSFEYVDKRSGEVLGMKKYAGKIADLPGLSIIETEFDKKNPGNDEGKRCNTDTHGGFDNDRATMNDILSTILGDEWDEKNGFRDNELKGY